MHPGSPTSCPARGGVSHSPVRDDIGADGVFAWTVRPARPARHIAACALVVAVTMAAGTAFLHNTPMAVICSLAVLGAVAEGLWPAHHRIGPDGARTRCGWQVRAIPWSAVKSVWHGSDGVYLCPFTRPSPILRTRGVILKFPQGAGPDVAALVRRYWKEEDTA